VGSLDDVRLYRRALPADNIRSLAVVPEPPGPWAHWELDESSGTSAVDAADHGKDAVVTGGTWLPIGGRIGGALSFDGTTLVTLPGSMTVQAPSSVAMWLKTTKGGVLIGDQRGPYPTEMVKGSFLAGVGPLSSQALAIGSDGTLQAYFMNLPLGGPGRTPDVRDGQWHHIAVTSATTGSASPTFTVTLYLDGKIIDSGSTPQGIWASLRPDSQLGVGRRNGGEWTFYSGLIDDVRVYSRVLTAEEVGALAHPN
jgi:Concanavalin A-like lectin/glucanases superfamily